jgi:hypothetical protein
MLFCTICGLGYHAVGSDRIDICAECWRENFAGSQEMQQGAPRVETAREALEAYVDSVPREITITPRQVQAMRRM